MSTMRAFLLLLCVTIPSSLAQTDSIGCFEPGECTGSLYIDVGDAPDGQVQQVPDELFVVLELFSCRPV